jgi:hypothetical protein
MLKTGALEMRDHPLGRAVDHRKLHQTCSRPLIEGG